jgi:hypothetical protein
MEIILVELGYFLFIFVCTFNVENYLLNSGFTINSYDVSCLSNV